MRNLIIVFSCLALLGSVGLASDSAPQSSEQRATDAEQIQQHIDSIFQAFINKDRDKLRSTHAENWRGFLRPSTSIVKGIEGYMSAAEAALSGEYGMKEYRFVEYETLFYGDTAIVTYIAELTPGRPTPTRPMIRVLDVYEKLDGQWIQVASQTAPHPATLAAQGARVAPGGDGPRDP